MEKQQLKKEFGSLLINPKQLTKEDQERCEELMSQKGLRLEKQAIQLGIFSEKQIKTFLTKQNELVTSQALTHTKLEFIFYETNVLPENYVANPTSLLQNSYLFAYAITSKKGSRNLLQSGQHHCKRLSL